MRARIKKITAGDASVYPFNHAFTAQERKVFQIIDQLRTTLHTLKSELAQTPYNACQPSANYNPEEMETIHALEENLDSLDLDLRWIPGGVYRYE